MLTQSAILAVVAGGLTIVLVLGDFDLSIASTLALGGVVAASVLEQGSTALAVLCALGAGAAVGVVNGIIVAYIRVNAFIATLGVGAVVTGVVLAITQGSVLAINSPDYMKIGQAQPFGLPSTALVAFALLLALWIFLNKTEPGRRMDAIGGNSEASRLSGIRVARYRLLGFVISGVCAAGAGVLLAAQLGAAYTNSGDGFLLQAFTACFLGAVTLRASEFHVVGTAVGVLIMIVAFNGLTQLGVEAFWQSIAQGAILLAAVSAAALSGRLHVPYLHRLRTAKS
ncbi:MAG: ABC transporter permease [Rhodococcus sp. (in: high G+C Gram-positive bacteria)]